MNIMPHHMTHNSSHTVLVSGAGSMGQRHVRNLHALGITELAFSDPHLPEDAERLAAKLDIKLYPDFQKALLSVNPDIVFLCAPTQLHVPQALDAVRTGAHLFIEKPLSYSLADVERLCSLVEEKGCITMVGCNMRYHPGAKQVKEWIDSGAIGEVISARVFAGSYLPRWRRKIGYKESYSADPDQGGAALDCVHEIDLALWYFGFASLRHSITLPAANINLSVDGLLEMLLLHKSGVLSSIHLNFIQQDYRRGCQIIGSKGTIYWTIRVPPGLEKCEEDRACVELYGANGERRECIFDDPEWDRNSMYLEEIEHFLTCIDKEMHTSCPLSHGKEALKIALAARSNMARSV